MKKSLFTFSFLLACALQPAPAQNQNIAPSAPPAPAVSTPAPPNQPLPPEVEGEFLSLLAATDPEPPHAPPPPIGPKSFTVRVTPPEEGGTEASVHIVKDGENIVRRVNVGNARKVLIGDGQVTAEHLPRHFGTYINTMPPPPQVPTTWLGVATVEASEEVRAQLPLSPGTGLIVRSVVPDSPASKAGLQKHDVIAKLDDQLLVNTDQFRALVSGRKDQDTVKITCFRQGKEVTAEAKLAVRLGGDDPWSVATVVGGRPAVAGALMEPLVMRSKALIVDPQGNVITATSDSAGVSAELSRLQEALKKAGVSPEVASTVEKNLSEVREQLEKSKVELERNKSDTIKRLEQSAQNLAKALENARAAAETARKNADRLQGEASKVQVPQVKP